MGLRFADLLAMRQISRFFDLDSARRERARADFGEGLAKLRREEFPRIAATLSNFADAVEKNRVGGRAGIERLWNDVQAHFRAASLNFEALGQNLVEGESARGFAKFDAEFAATQRKEQERVQDPEREREQMRKRAERAVKESVEKLRDPQMAMLEGAIAADPPQAPLRAESRRHLFSQFQAARTDPVARKAFVRRFFADWDGLQTKTYLEARQRRHARYVDLVTKIFESLDAEQKENLIRNLRRRADELRSLASIS